MTDQTPDPRPLTAPVVDPTTHILQMVRNLLVMRERCKASNTPMPVVFANQLATMPADLVESVSKELEAERTAATPPVAPVVEPVPASPIPPAPVVVNARTSVATLNVPAEGTGDPMVDLKLACTSLEQLRQMVNGHADIYLPTLFAVLVDCTAGDIVLRVNGCVEIPPVYVRKTTRDGKKTAGRNPATKWLDLPEREFKAPINRSVTESAGLVVAEYAMDAIGRNPNVDRRVGDHARALAQHQEFTVYVTTKSSGYTATLKQGAQHTCVVTLSPTM